MSVERICLAVVIDYAAVWQAVPCSAVRPMCAAPVRQGAYICGVRGLLDYQHNNVVPGETAQHIDGAATPQQLPTRIWWGRPPVFGDSRPGALPQDVYCGAVCRGLAPVPVPMDCDCGYRLTAVGGYQHRE